MLVKRGADLSHGDQILEDALKTEDIESCKKLLNHWDAQHPDETIIACFKLAI